jgi:hypothetical protein
MRPSRGIDNMHKTSPARANPLATFTTEECHPNEGSLDPNAILL